MGAGGSERKWALEVKSPHSEIDFLGNTQFGRRAKQRFYLPPSAFSRSGFLSFTDHATPRDVARALRSDSGGVLALLQMSQATS